MKEAEKIINGIKYWSDKDQKNRTAVVILADKKEEGKVWGHLTGTTREIGNLIYSLMTKNKELGHDIYVAACIYAHKHFTAEERDIINAVISASAEASTKSKGGEK